jgi:hypothetical protein
MSCRVASHHIYGVTHCNYVKTTHFRLVSLYFDLILQHIIFEISFSFPHPLQCFLNFEMTWFNLCSTFIKIKNHLNYF